MSALLAPASVAVVGASDRPGSYGGEVLLNLARLGYPGRVYAVNPGRSSVHGVACVGSLDALDEVPDAVVVAVRAADAPDVVAQAHARGCGGAVVFAAGFAEARAVDLQARLVDAAGEMPVCGPNGNGIVSLHDRVALWGDPIGAVEPGAVAVISQSGNVAVNALASRRGLRLHTVVSCGNQAVLDAADFLGAVAERDGVRSVALYLEDDGDGARWCAALERCARAGVRVAVLKAGSSRAGAAAAEAHTGAIAGDARVFRALFEECGAAWTEDPHDLLEVAKALGAVGRRATAVGAGGAAPARGGGATTVGSGGAAPARGGGATTVGSGGAAPARGGGATTVGSGGAAPARGGGATTVGSNGAAPLAARATTVGSSGAAPLAARATTVGSSGAAPLAARATTVGSSGAAPLAARATTVGAGGAAPLGGDGAAPRGVAVMTCSGGDSAVAADLAARLGVELPMLAPATLARLEALLPAAATAGNPLDYTSLLWDDVDALRGLVDALDADPGVGRVLVLFDAYDGPAPILDAVRDTDVVVASTLPELASEGAVGGIRSGLLAARALATAPDADRIAALGAEHRPRGWVAIEEHQAKAVLREHGIPVVPGRLAHSEDDAVAAWRELGGPVAMKVTGVRHKAAAGGVALHVDREADVRAAFRRGLVFVERMALPGLELLVAVRRQGVTPVLVVGLGGAHTELLDRAVIVPLPASRARVREALATLGLPDVSALAHALPSLPLALIELNPVIVGAEGAVAVDALADEEVVT